MIPNLLTASRLVLLVPIMILLAYGGSATHWIAFWLFVLAGMTDFLDGWTARKLHCVSNIGIFFDPLVDKVFANILLVFLSLNFPRWTPPTAVLFLLAREFAVQGFRSMAPCKGVVLKTRMVSKLKFVFQTVSVGAVLAGVGVGNTAFSVFCQWIAWIALALALVAGYASMATLFWKNRDLWGKHPVKMELR